jgi:hypothetical protein
MAATARDASVLRTAGLPQKNIQPSLTCRISGQIESNYDETVDSFDAMNLKAELLRGVYAYGFERPSAIQQRAIMPVIKGKFASITAIPNIWTNRNYRSRCHCPGSVRNRQDRHLLRLCPPEDRSFPQGLPGAHPRPNS